jgi:hypothetical protein
MRLSFAPVSGDEMARARARHKSFNQGRPRARSGSRALWLPLVVGRNGECTNNGMVWRRLSARGDVQRQIGGYASGADDMVPTAARLAACYPS